VTGCFVQVALFDLSCTCCNKQNHRRLSTSTCLSLCYRKAWLCDLISL